MSKISAAKRVRNMIKGLEELEKEHEGKLYLGLISDIKRAKEALERLWKSLVG